MSKIQPQKLFLMDSLGALLSAILLGFILARFEPIFGMPQKVVYVLAIIPCIFSIYSFFCFFKKIKNWQVCMKIIAIANVLYCCLTLSLMLFFYQKLTVLGLLYFGLEIVIIVILAFIELKMVSNIVRNY